MEVNSKTYQRRLYGNQLYEARYFIKNTNDLKALQALQQLASAMISLRS